ncbi:MAG TPA: N-acetylmuramoyl-L-alanine amidase [Acidimicrobiales bacterium]|jgi:hypothetical protein|nr:N-acetylmuramoyl-L-alanine amidase [Acidimicrobiales bacterium]
MRLDLDLIDRKLKQRGIDTLWNPEGVARGREIKPRPEALILHDTVTTRSWTAGRVWKLLTHGRPKVPGPLANLSPDRSGVVWFVANGRANHNGFGRFDNDSIGIETQCAGGLKNNEEPWNDVQFEVNAVTCQVLQDVYGELPILGHRESDPGRKIDPFGVDMNEFRIRVRQGARLPPEEEEMIVPIHVAPGESKSFHIEPPGASYLGVKECLVVLSSHALEPVPCWVWAERGESPRGHFGVSQIPHTFKPDGGWLHIRNEGSIEIGGSILYRR